MARVAYLDCQAGIAGDTLLGALLDAGFSLDSLKQALALLPINGYTIALESFTASGIHGSQVTVTQYGQEQKQTVHSISDIETLLLQSRLSTSVRDNTLAVFRHLAEAQANVDGISAEQVSFPESEMIDALISIVGAVAGIEALGITALYVSALPLTSGHVQTINGLLPVPTPMTLELLRPVGAIWKPCPVEEELVTPIAAAILATLARFETPPITIKQIGYGFGQRRLPWPDCFRLYLGEHTSQDGYEGADTDWVTVLSSNIDNMSGELLGGLMERLFAAGALDVSYTPMQMKKNRPATMLMVICLPEKGDALALVLLREGSTLGVRIQQMQRIKAQRTQQQIKTPLGPMLVKVKRLGSRVISAAPEYEDCRRIAQERGMPLTEVYALVQESIENTLIYR